MNTLIKKLMNQAGQDYQDNHERTGTLTVTDMKKLATNAQEAGIAIIPNILFEKFAHLIIDECLEAVRRVPFHSNTIDYDADKPYQDAIKDHFCI